MGLSRIIARNAGPLLVAGAAGAIGAVLAQRKLLERRRPALPVGEAHTPGPPAPVPDPRPPMPGPGSPVPDPPSPPPQPGADGLRAAVRQALVDAVGARAQSVDVEAEGGTVVLRGPVDSAETLRELRRAVDDLEGAADVRVLLHLPGAAVSGNAR